MPRRLILFLALATGLGLGATAIAQEGGSDQVTVDMQRGCLTGTRVTVRIVPPAGAMLSPVHIRTEQGEAVHLTGVTSEASVTVRVRNAGRVSVSGETTGGRRFSVERDYRRCSPEPPATPAPRQSPPHTVTGGGEG